MAKKDKCNKCKDHIIWAMAVGGNKAINPSSLTEEEAYRIRNMREKIWYKPHHELHVKTCFAMKKEKEEKKGHTSFDDDQIMMRDL